MKLSSPIPILRTFDETKAREHYGEFLGFNFDWEHRFGDDFPLYLQISLDSCIIHLSEHHGDASPGATIRIETDGLRDYCDTLNEKNYKFAKPSIKTTQLGEQQMRVKDPFGNKLIFFESAKD
jgi:hypothetical protein